MLGDVLGFVSLDLDDWTAPVDWSYIDVVPDPADVEIAIAYTETFRCKPAFHRLRRAFVYRTGAAFRASATASATNTTAAI
jgi:hypothetical protein